MPGPGVGRSFWDQNPALQVHEAVRALAVVLALGSCSCPSLLLLALDHPHFPLHPDTKPPSCSVVPGQGFEESPKGTRSALDAVPPNIETLGHRGDTERAPKSSCDAERRAIGCFIFAKSEERRAKSQSKSKRPLGTLVITPIAQCLHDRSHRVKGAPSSRRLRRWPAATLDPAQPVMRAASDRGDGGSADGFATSTSPKPYQGLDRDPEPRTRT
jgi:hypothetical protein